MSDWNYVKPVILTLEQYKERYDIPDTDDLDKQDILIQKFLNSAHDQVDSISFNHLTGGSLYDDWDTLNPESKQDQKEVYLIQGVIGDWTEYMMLTGRAFANLDKSIQAAIPFDLKTSASDGNLEFERGDILLKFAKTRFYKTTGSITMKSDDVVSNEEYAEDTAFLELVKKLRGYFLSVDGSNQMEKALSFLYKGDNTGSKINGVGDIVSGAADQPQDNWPVLKGFNINQGINQAERANVVFDKVAGIYKYINDFAISTWDGLTKDEIIFIANEIFGNVGVDWQADTVYVKNQQVFTIDKDNPSILNYFYSKIDNNQGNEPSKETNPYWQYVPGKDIPISEIITQLKPFIVEEVAKEIDSYGEISLDNFIESGVNEITINAGSQTAFTIGTTNEAILFLNKDGLILRKIINMDGNWITNVRTPVNDGDAVSKSYVDNTTLSKKSERLPYNGSGEINLNDTGVPWNEPTLTAKSTSAPSSILILPRIGTTSFYVLDWNGSSFVPYSTTAELIFTWFEKASDRKDVKDEE